MICNNEVLNTVRMSVLISPNWLTRKRCKLVGLSCTTLRRVLCYVLKEWLKIIPILYTATPETGYGWKVEKVRWWTGYWLRLSPHSHLWRTCGQRMRLIFILKGKWILRTRYIGDQNVQLNYQRNSCTLAGYSLGCALNVGGRRSAVLQGRWENGDDKHWPISQDSSLFWEELEKHYKGKPTQLLV